MEITKLNKQRGRPPAFNHEDALEKALQVFWQRGYEGASMAELTETLGINRPSIYAAFGNKEALFRRALSKYAAGPVAYIADALSAPTANLVVEKILTQSALFLTDPANPSGCMMVLGALSGGKDSELIKQELIAHRKNFEEKLKQRFELAKTQSELAQNVDAASLAKYIATLHQGLSVQAASGAKRDELLSVVELALKSWAILTH